jgi:transposase
MDTSNIDTRQARGLAIARSQGKLVRAAVGGKWVVPSQSANSGGYVVDVAERTCSCPDHETRAVKCKHMWAVEFVQKETVRQTVTNKDGSQTVTEVTREKRVTYAQHWPSYNAAQCEEKERVELLLQALCAGVEQPQYAGNGRPSLPYGDVIYGAVMKVYTTFSGRRATTDLRSCERKGLMKAAPSYNTIFRYLAKPELTPILKGLIEESAAPLAAIETDFAADGTGFSTCTYRRWFDAKYGKEMSEQRWIKLHAMVGTMTNVIVAAEMTESYENDCPQFKGLVETTAKRFTMKEVSADKAYLDKKHFDLVAEKGGTLYVPFKPNSRPGKGQWAKLWHLYSFHREEFLGHYHKRSNVESTFSAVKRKLGPSLRSKVVTAQFNEALCKVLGFNLTMLVHSIHELGIDPKFWQPSLMNAGTQ